MAQTYAQLQKQIAGLAAQAEKLKSSEVPGVIEKIRDLASSYGITAADIFGSSRLKAGASKKSSGRSRVKYADADGNTWVGMGKRPQWIRDALDAGRSLDEFVQGAAAKQSTSTASAPARKAPAQKRKGAGKAKYRQGDRSWSGFGPQPAWLKEAIAQGKSLDDFRA